MSGLRRIYSSKQFLELVQKLWQEQLAHSPKGRYDHVLERQGDEAGVGSMHVISVKKYLEASSKKSEERRYDDALRLSSKAERFILKVIVEMFNGPEVAFSLSSGDSHILGRMTASLSEEASSNVLAANFHEILDRSASPHQLMTAPSAICWLWKTCCARYSFEAASCALPSLKRRRQVFPSDPRSC